MALTPPLFRRVFSKKETTGESIAEIQNEFELFWRSLNRRCKPNREKSMALARMQEACMWFSRALAIDGFVPENKNEFKAPFVHCNDIASNQPPSFENLQSLPLCASNPVIITKKRKFSSVITPNAHQD